MKLLFLASLALSLLVVFVPSSVSAANISSPFGQIQEIVNNYLNDYDAAQSQGKNLNDIINLIIDSILNPVVALIVGLAVVYFMWGVLKYVNRGHDDGAEAIKMMTYGIIAIFVMVSVWGLVFLLINTFDLNSDAKPPVPVLR